MKDIYLFLIFTLFSCFVLSCSNDEITTNNTITEPPVPFENNFKYPYNINSFWFYTTRNFVENIRPDSLLVYFNTDTTVGYGDAKFEKDTLINSDTLRLLRNTHSEPEHSHTTLEYYRQTDSGLIRVAYYSDGTNFGPYRAVNSPFTFSVSGKTFGSLNELYEYYQNDLNDIKDVSGKLVFDDPPVTTIKYPIVQNLEWSFQVYGTTRITKKFHGFENINLTSGTFHCVKIQRNWYYNSPSPDTSYISYDYFSKEGMIKRDFSIKDIIISNQAGTPIGIIDVKEEANLNLYTLP